MTKRTCLIDGCSNKVRTRGWCEKHYYRWYRHGDPLITKSFTSPEESFSDRTEWRGDCLVWTGSKMAAGYGRIDVNGVRVLAHRYSWEKTNGTIPDNVEVDHKCHNKTCVNVEHLRLATISQNRSYLRGAQRNSATGVRNVHPNGDKWRVRVKKHGKEYYFGIYDDIKEAAAVAEQARKDLFGDFAGRG